MFEDILKRSLLLNYYIKFSLKNKPKFNALLQPIQNQINYILEELVDLIYMFSIDKAKGIGLDYIGIVIGQPRITANYTNNNFILDSSEQGFDSGIFDAGGDYIKDDLYRILLKSKVIKNNAKGWSRDEIISYHKAMLPNEVFEVSEDVSEVTLKFEDELDNFSYQLLAQYPVKIAGVRVVYDVPV